MTNQKITEIEDLYKKSQEKIKDIERKRDEKIKKILANINMRQIELIRNKIKNLP